MFYSSLLGDIRGEYEREKGKSLPIVFSTEGLEDVTKCKVLHDKIGKRVLVGGTNAEDGNGEMVNIFSFAETGKDMEAKPTPFKNAPNFTYGELADTEENPIVVVLTKGIRFFSDIPTYVEVLYINNDMMLVSLIYGACEFQFEDGSYIPLQRCNEYDLNRDILVQSGMSSVGKRQNWRKVKYFSTVRKPRRVCVRCRTCGKCTRRGKGSV